MKPAPRDEPTEAQLRAVWARCRRADWPDTYEDTMADALLSRLVRLHALHPAPPIRRAIAAAAPAAAPTRPARHWQPPPAARENATPVFDRKRAASGERDDD